MFSPVQLPGSSGLFFRAPSFGQTRQDRPNDGAQPLHAPEHEEDECHVSGKNCQGHHYVRRR